MKKIFNLLLLISVLFIATSCFSKEEENIEVVKLDFTISSGTGGGGGTPSPQGGTRR